MQGKLSPLRMCVGFGDGGAQCTEDSAASSSCNAPSYQWDSTVLRTLAQISFAARRFQFFGPNERCRTALWLVEDDFTARGSVVSRGRPVRYHQTFQCVVL